MILFSSFSECDSSCTSCISPQTLIPYGMKDEGGRRNGGSSMVNMKERGRPCLGTQKGRQNQRGRWKSSCQDRNKTFLNFFLWFGFIFNILGCGSDADSLIDSDAQCTGGATMRKRRDMNQLNEKTIEEKTPVYEEILSYPREKEEGLYESFKEDARCTTAFKLNEHIISPTKYKLR